MLLIPAIDLKDQVDDGHDGEPPHDVEVIFLYLCRFHE